jgi:hypothetical protein
VRPCFTPIQKQLQNCGFVDFSLCILESRSYLTVWKST